MIGCIVLALRMSDPNAPRVEILDRGAAAEMAATAPIEIVDPVDAADNKWLAAIAYLGPLVFVALLLGPPSPFARYHLNQGLVLGITTVVCWVVGLVCDVLLMSIPIVGWLVAACIPLALFVGWLVLAITGVLNAVNGRASPLPVIGRAFRVLS